MPEQDKPKTEKAAPADKYVAVVGITDDAKDTRFEPGDVVTGLSAADLKVLAKQGSIKKES